MTYDLVVVGLGAMGSAVLENATRRGLRVLGIEQYAPVHERGSFYGKSRMIRKAYFEQPAYVPLLLRAYDLWDDLERRSGVALLSRTGVLQVGLERSPVVRGVLASARMHGLDVQSMDAADIRRRYPMTRPRDDEVAVFERDGGVLASELAVFAQQQLAIAAGAQARFGVRVARWSRARDAARGLDVVLGDGSIVHARRLALCNGPWLDGFTDRLAVPIAVQRKVQVWFEPDSDAFAAGHFPAFLVDRAGGETLYGFPDFGDGVKAAFHTGGAILPVEQIDRVASRVDIAPIEAALQTWMPGAGARVTRAAVCQYDMTPDEHFIIGAHPLDSAVIVAAGFSGHGFKFAPVIGEIVVDLAVDGATRFDIGFLAPNRAVAPPEVISWMKAPIPEVLSGPS
jgi:sarcosine oxidase